MFLMTTRRGRAKRVVVAVIAAFNLGCYTAVPIAGSEARIGRSVEVDLTDVGTVQMASQVGPRVRSLTGDVTALTERDVVIALRMASDTRGIESMWGGEQVTVPRANIGSVSERRLSRGRTVLLSLGMVAGLYLSARAVGVVGGGDSHRGELPVTQ